MQKNFECKKGNNATVWKHSIDVPLEYDESLKTIVIHKNPYTWVESIAYRTSIDWIDTQTTYDPLEYSKFCTIGKKRKFNVINLCKTYKHFHDTWLPRADMIIRYEDLLIPEKRDNIISRIHTDLHIPKKYVVDNTWEIPEKGTISLSRKYDDSREQYYIKGQPEHLNDRIVFAINHTVTPELIRDMGYNVLGQ